MSKEYWSIIADAICDETGVTFDAAQTDVVIAILGRAHDDYGEQHGYREADKSVRRYNEFEARAPLVNYIERQMEKLDHGPNFFHSLSSSQKEGLSYLMEARKELRKRGMIA